MMYVCNFCPSKQTLEVEGCFFFSFFSFLCFLFSFSRPLMSSLKLSLSRVCLKDTWWSKGTIWSLTGARDGSCWKGGPSTTRRPRRSGLAFFFLSLSFPLRLKCWLLLYRPRGFSWGQSRWRRQSSKSPMTRHGGRTQLKFPLTTTASTFYRPLQRKRGLSGLKNSRCWLHSEGKERD